MTFRITLVFWSLVLGYMENAKWGRAGSELGLRAMFRVRVWSPELRGPRSEMILL